jgi:Lactonase, 7-bladed beta-propeller
VPNSQADTISVISGATCNAIEPAGCTDVSTVTVGSGAQAVALNPRTHSAYVANFNDGTVSVVSTAACNATVRSGCHQTPPTVAVGPAPADLVIDQASNTVFVQTGPTTGASLTVVAMINRADCNAADPGGCSQTPRTTPAGSGPQRIAENPATRTVYVSNEEDSSLSVINAATCNGTHPAGCNQTPPAILVGNGPYPIAVDQRTNTVYVANAGDGTLSMINAATCNANTMTGCGQTPSPINVGGLPSGLALDEPTDTLYITNIVDSDIQTIHAPTCNATTRRNCDLVPDGARVGGWGGAIALDPSADTAYVPDNVDGTVSLLALIP